MNFIKLGKDLVNIEKCCSVSPVERKLKDDKTEYVIKLIFDNNFSFDLVYGDELTRNENMNYLMSVFRIEA